MFIHTAASFRPAEKIALAEIGLGVHPGSGASGILAGTLVETAAGWRPVESLGRGARLATYDGGFCPLVSVTRRHVWPGAAANAGVIHVPGGALDNCSDFSMMPGQHVLVRSAVSEEVLGCGGVLVAATSLIGYRGIRQRQLAQPAEVIRLHFATEEVIYVNSGALIHCAAQEASDTASLSTDFDRLDTARAAAMFALMATGAINTADLACAA